ncbi:hypothetical protein N9D59_07480 [Burkholderiaceae bacterium]|nr:hypothetical protein [Burkholderiaceae bacterium]
MSLLVVLSIGSALTAAMWHSAGATHRQDLAERTAMQRGIDWQVAWHRVHEHYRLAPDALADDALRSRLADYWWVAAGADPATLATLMASAQPLVVGAAPIPPTHNLRTMVYWVEGFEPATRSAVDPSPPVWRVTLYRPTQGRVLGAWQQQWWKDPVHGPTTPP